MNSLYFKIDINEYSQEKLKNILELNQNLIKYIIQYNSKYEIKELLKITNKRLFKICLISKYTNLNIPHNYISDPSKLKFYDTISTTFTGLNVANKFCTFENFQNEIILAYPTLYYNNIQLISLPDMKKINTLVGHKSVIHCIRYYYCVKNAKDYLISSSSTFINVWNLDTFECIISKECYSSINN